ncbi:MAG: D-alanyl-D-alanine carboxypeptidase/D-alanyl-D-alanine-endopeptidase [Gammaproteobacteria bacterium]|nr:D-alanyl-D-alanine carboxypeptidase/D-alanyl-D-alanine-endopeptidase [Gammaproteobacteria bacterium]
MMKTALSIIFYLLSSSLFAETLQEPIDAIINKIDPKINLGMMVVDLNTGDTLYQRAITKRFIPASNMKLFSDASALLALGPDYRFQTRLSTDATSLEDGILHGSLYLSLPGDPTLTHTHLSTLFSSLKALGVTQITGSVILDSDFASIQSQPPGIVAKDLNYSYGASLAPVIFDENRVSITVNPSCQIGQPALIEYSKPNGSFVLENHVITVPGNVDSVRYSTTDDNHLVVRGKIGQRQHALQDRIAIRNPLRHAESLIKITLQNQGITLKGSVKLGPIQPSLLLATRHSKPLTQLLADTLKPSDNLYANSLYLRTASKLRDTPVDWQQAAAVLKQFMQQQTGIDMHAAVLADGSGLSRRDRLTAEQTVSLLQYLYEQFPLAYEYIAALPISGHDGTLEKRLAKPTQKGMVRAKTGSMAGILSLSGYLYTANNHTLAFAIFINTRHGTPSKISGRYRHLVDRLCGFLLKQKPSDVNHQIVSHSPHTRTYQKHPSDTDKYRSQALKWRRIEHALKQDLNSQPVTIVFRNNQLVVLDRNSKANHVWTTLKKINHKHHIAVTLQGPSAPDHIEQPQLLWVQSDHTPAHAKRVWTLRDMVG